MSVKPCKRNAEESFLGLGLKSREQKSPSPLLIQDKSVLQPTWCLLRRAQRFAPEVPGVWESLTRYHVSRGETDKISSIWQDFTRRHLRSPAGWRHAAFWYQYSNDRTAAVAATKQAHDLASEDVNRQEVIQVIAELM